MRIFSRKQGVEPVRKPAKDDFRSKPRRIAQQGQVAMLNGQSVKIRDISEDGVALEIDSRSAPDRGLLELFVGGRLKRRAHALRCWGRDGAVGYKLVDAHLADHAANHLEEAALKARAMERRLAAETGRARPAADPSRDADIVSESPAPGAQGRALRSRLGLS